jgi:hypothetical protein
MTQNNGETRFDFRTQIPAQINMGPNVGGAVFLEVSRSFRLTSKITRSRSIKLDVQIDSVTPDFGRFPVGGLLYDAELRKLVTPPETITRRSEVSAVVPAGGSLAIRRVNADLPDGDAELLALFTPKS